MDNAKNWHQIVASWAALASVLSFGLGLLAYWQNHSMGELEQQVAELQIEASSFDVDIKDGSLEFQLDGSVFAEPDSIRVRPVFSDGVVFQPGAAVPIPIDSGASIPQQNLIRYVHILDRVCEWPENSDKCENLPIVLLQVEFEVNGQLDTDDVPIGS